MIHDRPDGIRFNCPEDCGNAPRKTMLRDFTLAAVSGNIDFITKHAAESIVWKIAGSAKFVGLAPFADAMRELHGRQAIELEIHHIITHGRTGAVSGTVTYADGGRAFCDVYEFAGASKTAKIREITSYIIELSEQSG